MEFIEKIQDIQFKLKAPKDLYNSFGKYKYRNAEGILESVKPLLNEHGLVLTISDEIVNENDRYYVKATARITDGDKSLHTTAYAREALTKKGMDDSQITGTASSYARKYALNGLFLLDDTKDVDADEYHNTEKNADTGKQNKTDTGKQNKTEKGSSLKINEEQLNELKRLCKEANRDESYISNSMGCKTLSDLPASKFDTVRAGLIGIANKLKEDANE